MSHDKRKQFCKHKKPKTDLRSCHTINFIMGLYNILNLEFKPPAICGLTAQFELDTSIIEPAATAQENQSSYPKQRHRCAVTAQLISAFIYTDSTILLLKSKISIFTPASVTVQANLCQTWLESRIVGFLLRSLNSKCGLTFNYFFSHVEVEQPPLSGYSRYFGELL